MRRGEEPSESLDHTSVSEQPKVSESTDERPATGEQRPAEAGNAPTTKQTTSASSWFGLWSSRTTTPAEPPAETESTKPADMPPAPKPDGDVDMADAPASKPNEPPKAPSAGSTWAFWSRDTRPSVSREPKPQDEPGELAVFGERSESRPQLITSPEPNESGSKTDSQGKPRPETPVVARAKSNKRPRPDSVEIEVPVTPKSGQKQDKAAKGPKQDAAARPISPAETPTKVKTPAKDAAGATLPPNLLLPSFRSTYGMKEDPSIIRQIADFLLRTRQPPANHVYRVKEPPKIKKALAIGIHGLFPASYLKPIIGQPTGTSLRFASLAAEAIRRWTDDNGQEECEIEKVALEGEGRIPDRVNNLWTLLLNWIDHIRHSDLIILACHSQGVPVAIILLAKLIDLGIVTNAKIGVCAMGSCLSRRDSWLVYANVLAAGVSLGPFPDYKSSMGMFMGSAAELWDLANPVSEVSQRYSAALKEVLEYGVRITFIGSIDDQLVPMEVRIRPWSPPGYTTNTSLSPRSARRLITPTSTAPSL